MNGKFEKLLFRINTAIEKVENKLDGHKIKMDSIVKENDKKLFDLRESLLQSIEVSKIHLMEQLEQAKEHIG